MLLASVLQSSPWDKIVEAAAMLVDASGKNTLAFVTSLILILAALAYKFFGKETTWVRIGAWLIIVGCMFSFVLLLVIPSSRGANANRNPGVGRKDEGPDEIPQQFVGTWTGVRYEMAPNNKGYVRVKYRITKDGAITIFEYDYVETSHLNAVFSSSLNGLSFSESLHGDADGISRAATATPAHMGARIPDKPPRPNAEACGDPCLDVTVLTVGGDGIQQEGFLTRQ